VVVVDIQGRIGGSVSFKESLMKLWAVGCAVAVAGVFGGKAMGDTVTLNYVGQTPSLGSSNLWVDFNGSTPNVSDATTVGAFKWTVSAETGTTFTVGQTLYTFCIQASQGIASGTVYTTASLSGAPLGGSEAGAIDALAATQIQGLI